MFESECRLRECALVGVLASRIVFAGVQIHAGMRNVMQIEWPYSRNGSKTGPGWQPG